MVLVTARLGPDPVVSGVNVTVPLLPEDADYPSWWHTVLPLGLFHLTGYFLQPHAAMTTA